MSKYLDWIKRGDISGLWLEKALEEVREGSYPLAMLRQAVMAGLEMKVRQYERWIDEGSAGSSMWEKSREQDQQILTALKEGKSVSVKGVEIPPETQLN